MEEKEEVQRFCRMDMDKAGVKEEGAVLTA
jgi:hypothetical protein